MPRGVRRRKGVRSNGPTPGGFQSFATSANAGLAVSENDTVRELT